MDGPGPIWPPDEIIGAFGADDDSVEGSDAPSPPPDPWPAEAAMRSGPWVAAPRASPPVAETMTPEPSGRDAPETTTSPESPGGDASEPTTPMESWGGRVGVPPQGSPWAQPPRPRQPGFVPPQPPPATAADVRPAHRNERPTTNRRRHIAVISGTERAGRLVAKLLADELDRDHYGAAIVSDAGSVIGAPAWTSAVDAADQLVLAVDAVGSGPAEAANLIDRLAPTHHGQIRQAITVVLLPPARRGLSRGHEDIGAIRAHFQRRTRAVLFVPHDPKPTAASQVGWGRIVAELERGA